MPQGHVRQFSVLPEQPFRSFQRSDAQLLQPGVAARLAFTLLPTAFCFAKARVEFRLLSAVGPCCSQHRGMEKHTIGIIRWNLLVQVLVLVIVHGATQLLLS